MDLYDTLYGAFNLESKSLKELLELSSRIDYEKANNGMYADSKDELSIIASTIKIQKLWSRINKRKR